MLELLRRSSALCNLVAHAREMSINDKLFVTDTHMSFFEYSDDCPDLGRHKRHAR